MSHLWSLGIGSPDFSHMEYATVRLDISETSESQQMRKNMKMKKELYHAAMLHLANSTGGLWLASAKRNNQENISHQEDRWQRCLAIWLLQEILYFLCEVLLLIAPFNEGLGIVRVQKWLEESKCTPSHIIHNCG